MLTRFTDKMDSLGLRDSQQLQQKKVGAAIKFSYDEIFDEFFCEKKTELEKNERRR